MLSSVSISFPGRHEKVWHVVPVYWMEWGYIVSATASEPARYTYSEHKYRRTLRHFLNHLLALMATSEPSGAHKPKSRDLTRDERLQCLTLRSIDWTYEQISKKIGCTIRQV